MALFRKNKQPKEQFQRSVNRTLKGDIGIYIILAIFGSLMVIPLIYAIGQSLKPLEEFWVFPPRLIPVNPTFKNFRDLFRLMGDSWVPFSRYIFNTVLISVVGTAGNVILSAYAAYAISKIPFPGRNGFFKIIVYSLMFNATVVGITMFILMSAFKWIDTYLAIIIPAFCTTYGLYLMKQFMETSVPDEVLESARIEGASENKIFWKIAMPMVKPAWITLIIFAFKDLWNTGANMYIYSEQLKTFNYAMSQLCYVGYFKNRCFRSRHGGNDDSAYTGIRNHQSNIIQTMSTRA